MPPGIVRYKDAPYRFAFRYCAHQTVRLQFIEKGDVGVEMPSTA
ncbi:hypothetical protein PisoF_00969 [Pseudomonas sp. IsoF]|nr:hypothetical protein PisoF_00969 [Pseudomonas sp. IsoF]